jgi:acyl-CoA synthetase (AMP-forming)/AMP-acid ligase II
MNVIEMLRQRAGERPATVALVSGSGAREKIATLRELDRMSARVANQLAELGINAGDRVIVFEPMGIPLYALLLGLFRTGAVAVLIDPSARLGMIERACRRAAPKLAILSPLAIPLRFLLRTLRSTPIRVTQRWVPGSPSLDIDTTKPMRDEIESLRADAPALMTFTSGSTGEPKAAVRTHGFLRAQHSVVESSLEIHPGDVELTTLPVFVIANIASGITSVLPDARIQTPARINPKPVVSQVRRWEPNRALGSPSFFRSFVRGWTADAPQPIRRVYSGGGPVFPAMIKEIRSRMPNTDVVIVYGSTEAEPISHISAGTISTEHWNGMGRGKGLLVGAPIPQIRMRTIKSAHGVPIKHMRSKQFDQIGCGPGEPGEIVVSGDHVLPGYLDGVGDEQTKFRVDGTVWHRTGDAGYVDRDGALWLLGRCEAVITDKHGNLYPFAVECCALQYEWITSAACLAWEGERTLLVTTGRSASVEEKRELLEAISWAKLMHVMEVTRIPLDRRHNAKVEYPKLRELLRSYRYLRSAKMVEATE